MIIRTYKSSDCRELLQLFYDTVHAVNAKDYTEEQLNVWATGKEDFDEWNQSLLEHFTVVAVADYRIVGFGDIDQTGYLDRLYIHKNYQGKGIATEICDKLEKAVQTDKISVHASITAKPFFIGRGYKVIKEQQVERNNIMLTNYRMEKYLK